MRPDKIQESKEPFLPGIRTDIRTDAEVEEDIERKAGKNLDDREKTLLLRKQIEEDAEDRKGGLYH